MLSRECEEAKRNRIVSRGNFSHPSNAITRYAPTREGGRGGREGG